LHADYQKGVGKEPIVAKGIYQIDGDMLKMAFSANKPETERPTVFDPNQAIVTTLKRQKP
jgi:uncharacterized protein (TIGR03067 family)